MADHRDVVWLDETTTRDIALVGAKAAHLGQLIRAGLPVPDGFVVTSAGYLHAAEASGVRHDLCTCSAVMPGKGVVVVRQPEDLMRMAARISVPPDLALVIREAYRQLGHASVVAVRSSATCDDADDAALAGIHPGFTWVAGEQELLDHIRDCWQSLYSPQLVARRTDRHVTDEPTIAVVVQRMVDADRAGVAFVAGDERAVVVRAGVLRGHEREQVARLARQAAEVHRCPMEIEWGFAHGELWLVQARPMPLLRGVAASPGTATGRVPVLHSCNAVRPAEEVHRDNGRHEGDVHVGSMAGNVRPAPGTTTPEGREDLAALMREVLDQVRRHVRPRRPPLSSA